MDHVIPKRNASSGQGLVEYALILSIVVLVIIIAVTVFGSRVEKNYEDIVAALDIDTLLDSDTQPYCNSDMSSLNDWSLLGTGSNGWTTENGKMCVTNNNSNNFAYNNCSQSPMPSNENYVIHISLAELMQGNGYGVMFRLQDYDTTPSGYAFQYDPGMPGFVFRKWTNGKEDFKNIAAVTNKTYQWYNIPRDVVVAVNGTTMSAYIDGELILSATDSTYTSGGVGIRTWHTTKLCMDEFEISPLP